MLPLNDIAVATSGDYEKFFEYDGKRYHHILDPRTGSPASGTRSVTILGQTAMLADALATAVFVLGPKKGLELLAQYPQAQAIIIDANNEVLMTPKARALVRVQRSPTN